MKSLMSALLLSLSLVAQAFAGEAFTQERFDSLQADGKTVLVDVAADWCPTCKKQETIIKAWLSNNPDKELHVLRVDFDTQKDLVTHFRAPRQSTLLLYKNNQQLWFSVAETRDEVITAAIEQALASR
jgi:thiol-disulfide isomerase/thioredoxin